MSDQWIPCSECVSFEDCEFKEDRDGCYLGARLDVCEETCNDVSKMEEGK